MLLWEQELNLQQGYVLEVEDLHHRDQANAETWDGTRIR